MSWTGLLRVCIIIVIAGALVILAVWIWQRELIYFPDTAQPSVPHGAVAIELRTADGLDLTAWEFAPDPTTDRDAAVLVAPGNAGNRAGRTPLATALAAEGFTVLLLDYRGYGGNPGSPSETGLYADARAAWDHLNDRFEPGRILLFGESIGAGVVTGLSTEIDPAGLILRSPFTSLADVGQEHYPLLPVRLLLRDRFPIIDDLASNRAPVTVIYSEYDEIIPAGQSKAVAETAQATGVQVTLIEVEAYSHNDPALTGGAQVIDGVTAQADDLGLTEPRQ
ncbi:alpha/beta hydrolase [Glycomyces sp. YM15]|uniref:alpha/beta hydrolase n=1 Tax=Glycomyces sp. YM15 TaxID=2800446 RepID=UPI001963423D|nr:alpha/beta hydrolase [Glycomyces sp. YM15]